ncbi:MAG: hypothetical protein ACTS47_00235 [Candidatus Hodgkinia cicadicola]
MFNKLYRGMHFVNLTNVFRSVTLVNVILTLNNEKLCLRSLGVRNWTANCSFESKFKL